MPLQTYNAKRNFKRTAEPRGRRDAGHSTGSLSFVVQKHHASHLHYDFRLELDGVLLSWAVPKGPSPDPSKKSLAVRVEDHPLDYAGFEGTIPAGEYGGGTVAVWDRGTWTPIGDPSDGVKAGKLSFTLDGERLGGEWALVRMRGRESKNWLLIKKQDEHASSKTITGPDSIATGRSLEEIAEGEPGKAKATKQTAKPKSGKRANATKDAGTARKKRGSKGSKRNAPPSIAPQLAVLADEAPTGEAWSHEIKYDGYRLIATISDGAATLTTRNGNDWTHRFKSLAESLESLEVSSAVLDGEAVVLDSDGRSDFQALQAMLKDKLRARPVFFAFDLLFLDGEDLRDKPLSDRTAALENLLRGSKLPENIRLSERVDANGKDVLNTACKLGLEGIICKRLDAPYVSRRDPSWLKVKCGQRQEFVIVGFTEPNRSRVGLGALLLGYHDGKKQLVYAGRVGTGFDDEQLKSLRTRLQKQSVKQCPLDVEPPARERRDATWVKPETVAEVTFTGWTRDARLRHPVFVALRSDKPAAQITREEPIATRKIIKKNAKPAPARAAKPKSATATKSAPAKNKTQKQNVSIAGVTLSHPEKPLFPEADLTKRDVAEYMQFVSEWMLPHVARRPLALVRCPAGRGRKCFFQRNYTDALPDTLLGVDVGEGGKTDEHIMIENAAGLVSLVQMGVLEVHTWSCTADNVEAPDQIVFDLDPGDGVAWKDVVAGARLIRKSLEDLDLPVFLKTSGGKGLHLVVPIKPTIDWDTAKSFAGDVSRSLADGSDLFVANMRKDLRKGKIYIDFHRNGRSATSVAPYSTRAREGAPVSMPISWEELGKLNSASHFTVGTARRYLARRRTDPWQAFARSRVDLHKRLARAPAA